MKQLIILSVIVMLFIPTFTYAASDEETVYEQRFALYKKTETHTQIPWYYIAAVDQYERQIHKESISDGVISISIPKDMWFGALNPTTEDKQNENLVAFFEGIGKDGNGDGIADRTNDEDILYTFSQYIQKHGQTKQDFKIAIWNFYKRELTVQTIVNNAKVFQTYNKIYLPERVFPVPPHRNYSYKNTWGDPRGFGGRRIHEGTDIFASYGVPVRSTTYGVIEMKGWNRFGGWRIGIRDINNIYHYFAHLNGFEKGVRVGQVVKPGDVVGYVGASGYGPPGTSGKFPPHLHYGLYKDNGYSEWSFDPYPYLRKWERQERNR